MGDFPFGQRPELARNDVQREWTEGYAFDFFDVVANVVEHAANLAIAAFNKNDFQPRIGGIFQKADFGGRRLNAATILEGNGDPATKTLQGLLRRAAADFHVIGLGYM